METSYSEIKKKNVINVLDGRDLGKVIDMTFFRKESAVEVSKREQNEQNSQKMQVKRK